MLSWDDLEIDGQKAIKISVTIRAASSAVGLLEIVSTFGDPDGHCIVGPIITEVRSSFKIYFYLNTLPSTNVLKEIHFLFFLHFRSQSSESGALSRKLPLASRRKLIIIYTLDLFRFPSTWNLNLLVLQTPS